MKSVIALELRDTLDKTPPLSFGRKAIRITATSMRFASAFLAGVRRSDRRLAGRKISKRELTYSHMGM
jgi:hypothetical protein